MFPAIVYIVILNMTSIDLEHEMFIRIFVLDSLSEPINYNILVQKIIFSCSAHESARIAMESKGIARHLYIPYTVGNA